MMMKRRFGRTDHMSTVAIFGAAGLGELDQALADQAIQQIIDSGINHIDIAPSYGQAENRLGPWMSQIRQDVFLGCKTTERSKESALREFNESLKRLRTDHFDLYQLHAVTTREELDLCTAKGGSLEAAIAMREERLTNHIGITGHGMEAPALFIEALDRFDFDSVLFPLNPTLFADATYQKKALELLDLCEDKDVGVMTIKFATKGPWGDQEHTYHTWYEPFDDQEEIQTGVNFALSYPLTHICTTGDYRILPKVIKACEHFTDMDQAAREELIRARAHLENIF
jgi:predicted aldo/keto reductase-like oxidoreductase